MNRTYCIFILICAFALFGTLSLFAGLAECEHSWTYTPAGESTHTAVCSVCRESKTENHTLTTSKTPPSCDKPSVITYSCGICGYSASYNDGEPSANHTFGSYTVTRAATCEKEGQETRVCSVCGAKETRAIEKAEHNYGAWQQYDEKWHIRYCKVCDWAYKGSHRLDDGKIVSEPTETALGEITYTCRVCSQTFSRAVAPDGTVYVKSPEDVLGNGAKYLLVDTSSEDKADTLEVKLPGGGLIDILSGEHSEISLYANTDTGAYAGISAASGQPEIEVLPADNGSTVVMEFLKLSGNASIKIRIFNSDGAIAISNAGGRNLFISQKRDTDGSVVTLVMHVYTDGNHRKGSARLYRSEKNELTVSYGKTEYAVAPEGDYTLLGQAIWDYHKTSHKLTVNALNHKEDVEGIEYAVLEGDKTLMAARDIKKASGTVSTSSSDAVWRLRISFPCGYTVETPGYLEDGTFKQIPPRALMSEADLNAPVEDVQETVPEENKEEVSSSNEAEEANGQSEGTEEPAVESAYEDETVLLLNGVVALERGRSALYGSADLSSLTTEFDGERLIINVSGLPEGYRFASASCITRGTGFNFKIKTLYALPAAFELPAYDASLEITVLFENDEGNVIEANAGKFTVSFE